MVIAPDASARPVFMAEVTVSVHGLPPNMTYQVWRAIDATPLKNETLLASDYWSGAEIAQAAHDSGAEIIHCATVWGLDRNLEIGVSVGGGSTFIKAKRVVIATGAQERPFPIPGWTLPGVMTAGAAQTRVKKNLQPTQRRRGGCRLPERFYPRQNQRKLRTCNPR